MLAIAFLIVSVGSTALFWGLEVRFIEQSDERHVYFREDYGEGPGTLHNVAAAVFYFSPLVVGAIAYAAVVLVSPLRLRRSGWRFVLGLPVAVLSTFAVWVAMLAPMIVFPYRYS
jgi:hypothetical protein